MKTSCARCRASLPQLLDEYGRNQAYSAAAIAAREHLASCETCAREWNIARNLRAETRALGLAPAPSHLRANVRAALEREAQTAPVAPKRSWLNRWLVSARRPAFAWSSGAVLAAFALFITVRTPQAPLNSSATRERQIASGENVRDESAASETVVNESPAKGKSGAAPSPSKPRRAAPAPRTKPLVATKPNAAPNAKTGANNSARLPAVAPSLIFVPPPAFAPPAPLPTPNGGNGKAKAARNNDAKSKGKAAAPPAIAASTETPKKSTIPNAAIDPRQKFEKERTSSQVADANSTSKTVAPREMPNAAAPKIAAPATTMSVRLSLLPRAKPESSGERSNEMKDSASQKGLGESSAQESGNFEAARRNDDAPRDTDSASSAKKSMPAESAKPDARAALSAAPIVSPAPATSAADTFTPETSRAMRGRVGALENRASNSANAPESQRRNGSATYSAPFSLAQPSGSLKTGETRRAILVVTPPRDAAKVRLCVTRDGLQLGASDTLWRGDARRGQNIIVPVSLRALRSGTVRAVVSLETLDGTILASQTVEVFAAP